MKQTTSSNHVEEIKTPQSPRNATTLKKTIREKADVVAENNIPRHRRERQKPFRCHRCKGYLSKGASWRTVASTKLEEMIGSRVVAHKTSQKKRNQNRTRNNRKAPREGPERQAKGKTRTSAAGQSKAETEHKDQDPDGKPRRAPRKNALLSCRFSGRRPLFVARYLGRRPRAVPLNPPP